MDDILSETANYYRESLKQHGATAKGVDWNNKKTQELRFDVISSYIDAQNRPSVLDVGCGYGAFAEHLKQRGIDCDYHGIDICPEMVDAAQKKYPSHNFRVDHAENLSKTKLTFDYVIASGTFNACMRNTKGAWRQYFHTCL
ncbi:class I SAM-dependent methyltransferase, partial [Rubripirellula sp.]|nr:class I SAM-dependent methyltransferase [Rubripirellula sp.]